MVAQAGLQKFLGSHQDMHCRHREVRKFGAQQRSGNKCEIVPTRPTLQDVGTRTKCDKHRAVVTRRPRYPQDKITTNKETVNGVLAAISVSHWVR